MMLFNMGEDLGHHVSGWVMPDNPAATPSVNVHLDAGNHVVVEASIYHALLREQGLHNTGVCGFALDENNCRGLAASNRLEIHEAETNLLLYRRRPDVGLINKKFFRLEPQLFRSAAVDDALEPRFQMAYSALDLQSEETMRAIMTIQFSSSIYISGRIFWRFWEPLLRDRGYTVGILVRDPFHEMAERLLILKLASSPQGGSIIDAIGPVVEAASGHLRNIDLKDFAELEALLAAAPIELRAILHNPLTHLLTARNAFDPPPMSAVASALESLADMDVVGLRGDPAPFFEIVSAMFDLPEILAEVPLPTSNTVIQWADFLRERPAVRDLVEMDIKVYQTAVDIIERQRRSDVASSG
jgi:hypothetical protein